MSRTRHIKKEASAAPRVANVTDIRPDRVFLVLALAAGLFMVFVTPPFQSPDEDAHFFRAFQLSEGKVIAEKKDGLVGGTLPVSAIDSRTPFVSLMEGGTITPREILENYRKPFSDEPRQFDKFIHTALYSPVAYAPAAVGIAVGRIFDMSALAMLYLSRLATLFCWIWLVFASIRLSPVFKWVIAAVALMPMSVFVASAPSADVMTNGLSILLVAYVLKLAMSESCSIGWGQWAWLVLISTMLALAKPIYFLLVAMVFVVPVTRFGGLRKKLLFCCGAVGIAAAAAAIWAFAVRNIVTTVIWAEPAVQIRFMLEQPSEFVLVLLATLSVWWTRYIQMFVGVLGWLDVLLPWWVYPSYIVMLLAVAVLDKGTAGQIRISTKVFLAAMTAVILLLIAVSQYITYSSPMAETIRGLQGRYAIPLAVPMLLLLYNKKVKMPEKRLGGIVAGYCAAVLAATCWTIVSTYY